MTVVANNEAARLHQTLTKSVDWLNIQPEAEVPVLEDIIFHLGKFPASLPVFEYPYSSENPYCTVGDRIELLSKRLRCRIVQLNAKKTQPRNSAVCLA